MQERQAERERQSEKETDRDRERHKKEGRGGGVRTTGVVLEGDAVALAQPLPQLTQDLLIPVLPEPHHLGSKQQQHESATCSEN